MASRSCSSRNSPRATRRAGLWTGETFFEILERQRAAASRPRGLRRTRKGRITYGELKDKVERCAEFLRRIGIRRGDVVTIQLPEPDRFSRSCSSRWS